MYVDLFYELLKRLSVCFKMPDEKKRSDKMSEIDDHIMRRFDIRRRLGKGAYGIVWKAIDRKMKRVVAIKKIFDAFRNQVDSQRTFREIMFLQAFSNHPNVIKLYSIHRAANNRDIYLGFEYMETDLHNVIKRQNLLKDIHMRYIMYQLFKAMKYIHSGNVIHRDMKPSNILLNSACHCKIADFGLARSVSILNESPSSGSDPRLTDYVATRWYRAPEILIANTSYTKGIDMWSLGCILGEMLIGKPIFPGSSTVNQVEKIMATLPTPTYEDISMVSSGYGASLLKHSPNAPKRSLNDLLKDSPDDAYDLVSKLLVFNPNRRFTAVECLHHQYVERFHVERNEPSLNADVIPPLSDDIQLSIDDYRNKLYELMSERNQNKITTSVPINSHKTYASHINNTVTKIHPNQKKVISEPVVISTAKLKKTPSKGNIVLQQEDIKHPPNKLFRNNLTASKNYIKNAYIQKDKITPIHGSQSEQKMSHSALYDKARCNASVDSIISRNLPRRNSIEQQYDYKQYQAFRPKSKPIYDSGCQGDTVPVLARRTTSNISVGNKKYSPPDLHYNSYNQKHGIITESAFIDLKSSM